MTAAEVSRLDVVVVLIGDDQRVRQALSELLVAATGFRVAAAVSLAEDPLAVVQACHADVVVLDLQQYGLGRQTPIIEALTGSSTPTLVLTAFDSVAAVGRRAGASAVVDKVGDPSALLDALRRLARDVATRERPTVLPA